MRIRTEILTGLALAEGFLQSKKTTFSVWAMFFFLPGLPVASLEHPESLTSYPNS